MAQVPSAKATIQFWRSNTTVALLNSTINIFVRIDKSTEYANRNVSAISNAIEISALANIIYLKIEKAASSVYVLYSIRLKIKSIEV